MTKIIRPKTFETNSSSTHALVIPHEVDEENYSLSDSLDHNYSYGREESRLIDDWDEKLAYLYITIYELNGYKWQKGQYKITKKMVNDFKKRINKIYKEVYDIVEYKPYKDDPKPNDIFEFIESKGERKRKDGYVVIDSHCFYPSVDHVGEFADEKDFFNKVFNDDEFLKRFIFNKSGYITVGGDEYRGYNIKTIGFQYDYKEDYINHGTEDCPQYEDIGEFWDKLKEYEKTHDVFLKGN